MTSEVFALLLDTRTAELQEKASETGLSKSERAELRALQIHQDKAPAVAHRIRILSAQMARPSRWGLLLLRLSRKFRQNLAELEALVQYGHSKAVWEIAYLHRKQAAARLSETEHRELHYLTLYHDCPDVVRIAHLKLQAETRLLNTAELRELDDLQRNPYRKGGIPGQVLEIFWPGQQPKPLDLT